MNHILSTKNFFLKCSILSISIYIFIAFYVLGYGYPHEDAYILFLYAENLADNGTISYYENGPPAEGATDFLWMVLISMLYKLGLNTFAASLFLNFLGLILILFCISKVVKISDSTILTKLSTLLLLVYIPLSHISSAAFGGFSTLFYGGMIFLFISIFLNNLGSNLLYLLPLMGLLVTLIRPDGFFFCVPLTVAGFFFLDRKNKNKYFFSAFGAFALGIAYFIWRYNYFGEILPLPFYVKTGATDFFPGVISNFQFVKAHLIFVLIWIYMLLSSYKFTAYLATNICLTIHFVILLYFEQTQNIGFRFNTPIFVLMLVSFIYFFNKMGRVSAKNST